MRNTHPFLYLAYAVYAVVLSIPLGLNMIFLTPAFMPLGIDKWWVGLAFLAEGLIKLVFLIRNRPDDWLRSSMGITIFVYLFWAAATTYDFFDRSLTSLQLPIFCAGVAASAVVLLAQGFTSPAPSILPISEEEK